MYVLLFISLSWKQLRIFPPQFSSSGLPACLCKKAWHRIIQNQMSHPGHSLWIYHSTQSVESFNEINTENELNCNIPREMGGWAFYREPEKKWRLWMKSERDVYFWDRKSWGFGLSCRTNVDKHCSRYLHIFLHSLAYSGVHAWSCEAKWSPIKTHSVKTIAILSSSTLLFLETQKTH